ncbi:MAG: hypothetical protein FWG42_01405 [Clostridiales bacterium]|nr:hypothetical protein [Clostridiales bacterium]
MKKGLKIFALLMAILLMAAFLPGCGEKGESGESGAEDVGSNYTEVGVSSGGEDDEDITYGGGENDIVSDVEINGDDGDEEGDVQISEVFFSTFDSGTYHMKFKIAGTEGGDAVTEQYVKDGKMAMTMTGNGITVKMIYIGEKAYAIDDATKTIFTMPVTAEFYLDSGGVETTGMGYIGSGTAEFAGSTLPYEEYSNEAGSRIQYFIRGNTLAGLRTIRGDATSDMVVMALDTNVPDSIFDLPEGYQMLTTD